ncbi:unnamed protein product [Sphagnum compactum]
MENSEPALKRPCQAGARKTPFQTKHALQYGLSITARDPGSSEVVAVRCQFCVVDRLLASWNQNAIDLIVDQHKKLLNVVIKEPRLQIALARHRLTPFSRSNLTPFSLEGIIHCRQIRTLLKI